MKRNNVLIGIMGLVLLVFGLSGCGLISKTPEGVQKTVVAKVNGEKIILKDYQKRLDIEVAQIKMQYGPDIFTQQPDALPNLKTQLLTQLVQENLIIQKGDELKLSVDDKTVNTEVDKQITAAIKQAGGEKAYEKNLKTAINMTPDEYKTLMKSQVKVQDTLKKLQDFTSKGASVTDQEVINYFYTHQYDYTVKPNTFNVSHILVKTLPEADKVAKEIKAGLKFTDAAKKYGTDVTKDKGGLLGDIPYTSTDYDKDFMTGAMATPTGKVSAPVKTQFGYHLIKVNSRHEYKVKPLDSVKASVKATMLDAKKKDMFNTAFATWQSKAKIEKYTDKL